MHFDGQRIRRRPAPDREPALAGPGSWEEFTGTELSWALAGTRWAADTMLDAGGWRPGFPGNRD